METAGDVLNLFLIKEKAPACVRDELLQRTREEEPQRGGEASTSPARQQPQSGLPASPARS